MSEAYLGTAKKPKAKPKQKRPKVERDETASTKLSPMRTATDVIQRVLWDCDLRSDLWVVGYEDRFLGIIERSILAFNWADPAMAALQDLSIPKHRIQYFKFNGEIVWDKSKRMDHVFASTGTGKTNIEVVMARHASLPGGIPPRPAEGAEAAAAAEAEAAAGAAAAGAQAKLSKKPKPKSRKPFVNADRPNYFVALKCDDDEVLSRLAALQARIVTSCGALEEAVIPPALFHITMVMLRIDTPEQMAAAKRVLREARPLLTALLPPTVPLRLVGLDSFRDRVLVAKPTDTVGVDALAYALRERMATFGVPPMGNHEVFTAHATVLKLSRGLCRTLGTIPANSYANDLDVDLGSQPPVSLHLCPVGRPSDVTEFYPTAASVYSSLPSPSLPSPPPPPPTLCEVEGVGALVGAVVAGAKAGTKQLVIVRGLPGSGKSTLTRLLRAALEEEEGKGSFEKEGGGEESKGEAAPVKVCRADKAFTTPMGYRWSGEGLDAAHEQCREELRGALSSPSPLPRCVVLDNTNSKTAEYRLAVEAAEAVGATVHVWEMHCSSPEEVLACYRRCSHPVPVESVQRMHGQWEGDERALLLPITFAPDEVEEEEGEGEGEERKLEEGEIELQEGEHVVYGGIMLSPASLRELLDAVPPEFAREMADHVTICYRPSADVCRRLPIGRLVRLEVQGFACDDCVQAVTVRLRGEGGEGGEGEGGEGGGLPWSADAVPHITVSTARGTPPSASLSLIRTPGAVVGLETPLLLTGTVGVVVEALSGLRRRVMVPSIPSIPSGAAEGEEEKEGEGEGEEKEGEGEEKEGEKRGRSNSGPGADADLHLGDKAIRELHVFDFDDTLLMTPDPGPGRAEYQRATGTPWPHAHWLSEPASLQEPLLVLPGPALQSMKEALGRRFARVVVLTGRRECMRGAVQRCLRAHGGDADVWILKPDDVASTAEWKAAELETMMARLPSLRLVCAYEDNDECVEAFRRSAAAVSGVREVDFSVVDTSARGGLRRECEEGGAVELVRALSGRGVSKAFDGSAQKALRRLGRAWAAVTGASAAGEDGEGLILPSGSAPLGRRGDLDIVLLTPPTFTHASAVGRLDQELRERGFEFIHAAPDARSPRLLVRVRRVAGPVVELDCSFAVLRSPEAFAEAAARVRGAVGRDGERLLGRAAAAEAPFVREHLQGEADERSSAALLGALHTSSALQRLQEEGVEGVEAFGAAMEFILLFLEARGLRSASLLCPRPFQLVEAALAPAAGTLGEAGSADALLVALVGRLCPVTEGEWRKRLGRCVPASFVTPLVEALRDLDSGLSASSPCPSSSTVGRLLDVFALPADQGFLQRLLVLLRPSVRPSSGFRVRVEVEGAQDCGKLESWRLGVVVHSRLGGLVGDLERMARTLRPVACGPLEAEMLVEGSRVDGAKLAAAAQPFVDAVHEAWAAFRATTTAAVRVRVTEM